MEGYATYSTLGDVPAFIAASDWDKPEARDLGRLIFANDGVLPAIGEAVHVKMNGLGAARVVGYFSEDQFLGLLVELDNPPQWYIEQNKANGRTGPAHVFGPEFTRIKAPKVKAPSKRAIREAARSSLLHAMVAKILTESECVGETAEVIEMRSEATKLALKWGWINWPGLPGTFRSE